MPFQVINLRKAYGGVDVLQGIDLKIADGEIHALLGANGAGKSTLIKCIAGAVQADEGQIHIGQERFRTLTPREARRAGIAVIYQELSLASSLSVADNVFLGQELRRGSGPFVRRREQEEETAVWLKRLGVSIDPRADLSGVGHAELQAIEIIKSLRMQPNLLVLDEPTASLSEREAARLRQHLLALKGQQLPILYVTHRMNEVFELADRFTVLRGGRVALSGRVCDHSREEIIEAIVGRKMHSAPAAVARRNDRQAPMLHAHGLLAGGIGPVDIQVRPGEILGVFGLVGSGRTELLETLFGARPLFGGGLSVDGKARRFAHPGDAVAAGVALVPSDRPRNSVFGSLTAMENWSLPNLRKLSRSGLRRPAAESSGFARMATALDLRPRRPELQAGRFSGGNQQKLVLGRWLERADCCVLLLDEPTQGVDVGARRDLYDGLRRFVEDGRRAAVVTSSEPGELIQLAHRVVVLSHGRVVGELAGSAIEEASMLALAHQQPENSRLPFSLSHPKSEVATA